MRGGAIRRARAYKYERVHTALSVGSCSHRNMDQKWSTRAVWITRSACSMRHATIAVGRQIKNQITYSYMPLGTQNYGRQIVRSIHWKLSPYWRAADTALAISTVIAVAGYPFVLGFWFALHLMKIYG